MKMQLTMPKLITILIAAVILTACTSFPSENVDPSKNNKDVFRKDLAECKQDYPESGSGIHFKQWTNCMNLKGWK
jgi:outer membrane PBP1 activator LpoA protein